MAVKNLESLVLRGVRVLTDVRMGLERNGSNSVGQELSATSLSYARHLFTGAEPTAGTRWDYPCDTVGKPPADRAGRLARSAGVLDSRSSARFAELAIPSGWRLDSGLERGPMAMFGLGRFLAGMPQPSMRASLICWSQSSSVKNRIPPVSQPLQGLQRPHCGTFTTH